MREEVQSQCCERGMKITAGAGILCLIAIGGCGTAVSDSSLVENETQFLQQCRNEVLHSRPDAVTWVDAHCVSEWLRIDNSAAMVEAILALASPVDAVRSFDDARARLPMVQWSAGGTGGTLRDLRVYLQGDGSVIAFHWQQQGSEVPFNVIDGLRIRGVILRTLGCPQYSSVSMGREKVMTGQMGDRSAFVLTVYSRPAPTGIDLGIYQVNVDFSGIVPEMAAMRVGHYPGGGGRAFAVDPIGWEQECLDPE